MPSPGMEAGCTVMDAQEAKVLQCQKCLEAQEAWVSNQLLIFQPTPKQRKPLTRLRPL